MDKINKGVELMLRRKKRREPKNEPNIFIIRVGKMVSLFKKDITIYFEFSLDLRNKRRGD
jgi:hypothetical protein